MRLHYLGFNARNSLDGESPSKGIHVHVHDGKQRIVDDTFSEVVLNGVLLSRSEIPENMVRRTIL